MTGGSTQPESPLDKECPYCGLYYMDKGVSFEMHKAACGGDIETAADGSDASSGEEPETSSDDTGRSESPVMGSGDVPTEPLPCGHEEVEPAKYEPGTYIKCDKCGKVFQIIDE